MRFIRRNGWGLITLVGAALLAGLVFTGSQNLLFGGRADAVRQVVFDARGPAFSAGTDNPVIEVRTGETVRFVLRNHDTGTLHSITVPELTKNVTHVMWGQQGELVIRADRPGEYVYSCPQHCPKMRGKLIVKD